jgi:hypothetical protein
MRDEIRPRQTWTPDADLREAQDAQQAAVARELARPLRLFGSVAQIMRQSGSLHYDWITPVDPTDNALVLALPKATQEIAGAAVVIVLIDGATTLSIGGLEQSTTILCCMGEGSWKVMAIV